eukprot:CAMPEP_0201594718 /NCGR_PEP_ID=MMETSP0190_2-20130828/191946_1 /ASSEMBLY_ACC=CAM_ASM_000263 /TAXON_ID=37353 /ORGANISM="Rosalina sp." /LENGTH=188 /DNA_ID=CAMNT_0048054431 /DNA_START=623 /DNA_END=1187 /DNA_ORIENTATION=-
MPNKHWKTSISRWRKALHAFVLNGQTTNDINNTETKDDTLSKDKLSKDTPEKAKFSCEKCSEQFVKFDNWHNHRQQCDGVRQKEKPQQQDQNNSDGDDDDGDDETDESDFDLFDINNMDQDIDFDFVASETKSPSKSSKSSTSTPGRSLKEETSQAAKQTVEEEEESLLLNALNNVLDSDEDSDGFFK